MKIVLKIFIVLSLSFNALLAAHYGITTENLNLRSSTNLKNNIIKVIPKGTILKIQTLSFTKRNTFWYKVKGGYVYNKYVHVYPEKRRKPTFKRKIVSSPNITTKIFKKPSLVESEKTVKKGLSKKEAITKSSKPSKIFIDKEQNNINNYFVSLGLGLAKISTDYKTNSGIELTPLEIDTDALNIFIQLGYRLNKKQYISTSYNIINFDDAKMTNILMDYNVNFDFLPNNLYLGVVGGVSYLQLTKSSIEGIDVSDEKGSVAAFGIQSLYEYELMNNLSFIAKYQYLKAEHSTNVLSTTTNATITRDSLNTLNIGLRYNF